ncbi:MAG: RNA chaperone Hfq [Nitrospirae bacterium]|nr:RNA chaperone Hfq [Nitrospirota bacterium]
MNKNPSFQDAYLNQLRKDKVPMTMFLMNGVRLKGTIKAFDSFVVLLKDATQQLVYKHAISTIVPDRDVSVNLTESGE